MIPCGLDTVDYGSSVLEDLAAISSTSTPMQKRVGLDLAYCI